MIHFTYQLKGAGWAVATISDARTEMTVPASFLCDALRDFVDAVQSLWVTDNVECRWELEPGEVRWEFRRDGSGLTVKVQWNDGRESFEGHADLLHFSSEVDNQLDELLAEWSAERYLKQWHYPFPHEAHYKLKQAIKLEQRRRTTTT
jgi:hypothetical protein